jgi:hypothetical protein
MVSASSGDHGVELGFLGDRVLPGRTGYGGPVASIA